jgi:hypothetical protein
MSSSEERPDAGEAGASARREHARRAARRERALREKNPKLGGVILALTDEPAHQRSWKRGAVGEERVGQSLRRHVAEDVVLLHDRRIPRSKANIDHIAITGSGVWVIDTKRYKGKVEVRKPLFGEPKLLIAGRDRSKLAEGLARQIELVKRALAAIAPEVPVHGAIAFVDADLPLLRRLSFSGYPLLYPRQLAKQLSQPGNVTVERINELARQVAVSFPSA